MTVSNRPVCMLDRWPRICPILITLEVFTNTNLSIKKSKDLELRSHHDHSTAGSRTCINAPDPISAPTTLIAQCHRSGLERRFPHVLSLTLSALQSSAGARELDKPAPRTQP